MRCWLALLMLIMLSSFLAGCGGHRRYNIETDGNGFLADVWTVPDDGDYDVPRNVWIRLYWPSGTEPPASFTFALRNDSDIRVHTYRHDGDQEYEYWFEPTIELDYDSRYKIELVSGEERVTSFFFTVEEPLDLSRESRTEDDRKAGPRITGPEEEHVVRTRR